MIRRLAIKRLNIKKLKCWLLGHVRVGTVCARCLHVQRDEEWYNYY